MDKVMFSSEKTDWGTPISLFKNLDRAIGGFNVDVCATPENAKVENFYSPELDGLRQTWEGNCWMNPPYGREIDKWVRKAHESKAIVVGLLPARTDTKWFHDYVPFERVSYAMFLYRLGLDRPQSCVCFLKGRLKFEGAKHSAPFPSMLVLWGSR